jgi:excisionase family DNA binding protein
MGFAINLAELLHDPAKVASVQRELIPTLRGELAMLDSLLLARLLRASGDNPGESAHGDKLLTVEQAAHKLGSSKDYLYRNSAKLPFTVRMGRQLRFSEAEIEKFIKARQGVDF